jgi:hypothetical protein
MTGFDSKRQMAQAKVRDDDDTPVYEVYADTLLIVYQRGFADGKAEQRKPLTDEEIDAIRHSVGVDIDCLFARKFARAIEAAHGIKEGT